MITPENQQAFVDWLTLWGPKILLAILIWPVRVLAVGVRSPVGVALPVWVAQSIGITLAVRIGQAIGIARGVRVEAAALAIASGLRELPRTTQIAQLGQQFFRCRLVLVRALLPRFIRRDARCLTEIVLQILQRFGDELLACSCLHSAPAF